MTPAACALFPQRWYRICVYFKIIRFINKTIMVISSLDVSTLARFEPESYKKLVQTLGPDQPLPNKIYFNKGL